MSILQSMMLLRISYSPDQFDLTKDTPMVAVHQPIRGPIITWWISPSLSAGLNFDTSTGEISGDSYSPSPNNYVHNHSNK